MAHPEQALLGAYALGALEADERWQLEKHLASCRQCQDELAGYQQVMEGLLHLPPQLPPPARLRAGLERRLGGAEPDRPRKRRAGLRRVPQLALGALAGALVVLNAGLLLETRRLAQRELELLAQQEAGQTALALASYPSARTALVRDREVWGTFVYEAEFPVAVLNVWGLGALPPQQVYQLWLITPDGTRYSGALFKVAGSRELRSVLVRSPVPFGEILGFGITVEPEAGSLTPTGPRVLGADLDHSP